MPTAFIMKAHFRLSISSSSCSIVQQNLNYTSCTDYLFAVCWNFKQVKKKKKSLYLDLRETHLTEELNLIMELVQSRYRHGVIMWTDVTNQEACERRSLYVNVITFISALRAGSLVIQLFCGYLEKQTSSGKETLQVHNDIYEYKIETK